MGESRQNGFVLVLVIAAMAAIGAEMFVLAGGSNTMLLQSDIAYLRACKRNLVASNLAWAKRNIKIERKEIFNKRIKLNIADMEIPRANSSVIISELKNKEVEVQIDSLVSYRRQTIRHDGKYRIKPWLMNNAQHEKK
ncbi:MAG: hypothetical protein ACYS0I_11765 [Planctomycetota bacterium]|jgi:hypothetical protein